MRTLQVRIMHRVTPTMDLEISTEVIVEDDADVQEAGEDAGRVLNELLAGVSEGLGEGE